MTTAKPLLIDIGSLSTARTDQVLDVMYKAIGDPPGEDADIWHEHPSAFVSLLVELFTKRGLLRIRDIHAELAAWLAGERHNPSLPREGRPGEVARWTPVELKIARLYLESLPRDQWTLDDWSLLIDCTVERYMPADAVRDEAQWLAAKSSMMGTVQAAMGTVNEAQAGAIVKQLPSSVEKAVDEFGLTAYQASVMRYNYARCAENVRNMAAGIRHQLRTLIMAHQEGVMLGDKLATAHSLQTQLLDAFGSMNRDWRRIAVTEAGENANQGLIASLAPGARVQRVERYAGACPFCRKINGVIMRVASASDENLDGNTQVWPGKTNIGRSAAPRKRVGDVLIERSASERWWVAAGVQHPHCRGTWLSLPGKEVDNQPLSRLDKWLTELNLQELE